MTDELDTHYEVALDEEPVSRAPLSPTEEDNIMSKPKHTTGRVLYRYLSGRPLDGRTGHPYSKPGEGRWPGYKRQVYRLGTPAAAALALTYPGQAGYAAVGGGAALVYRMRRRWLMRRFTAEYVTPTLNAVTAPLGGVRVRLHVDSTLGQLTPRLAKPLSPAEQALRRWYGQRVEPVLRWPGGQVIHVWWLLQKAALPVTGRLEVFRRPGTKPGPRIELSVDTPYLTKEQRQLVSSIIHEKIPVADLVESWAQVGPRVSATWTVRKRPPALCGVDALTQALPRLAETEFFLGLGAGDAPVVISLDDDSPHIAVSAGTGAGKSVLAQLLGVQVLARGGRVVILDRKGSHRWALGLPGVDYCTRPAQMHEALIRLAELADERNTLALHEEEGWDPGPRHLVICEELNATIGMLSNYWADVREKGQPKRSPAINALGELMYMGRSAKVNVIGIAQMLTARAIGGPEARENFGVRCLARYSANNWKMLVPEASMPRASRTRGRWQVVIGGQATETQVAYLTAAQARGIASGVPATAKVPDGGLTSDVHVDVDMMTLQDAIDGGVIPWRLAAAQKRLQRGVGKVPAPRGRRGSSTLYAREDLASWAAMADA